ncbi:MAG: ketol-acid reductoisomerase [Nitrososphaeria archaeon]
MTKIYYDSDTSLKPLSDKTIAIIGYGSQGRAHALNLRDSGLDVVVGLRRGGVSWKRASEDGFSPEEVDKASSKADTIMILTPDTTHSSLYMTSIKDNLGAGKALGFAHGYSIRFGLIKPPKYVDVFMVAPKGPGAKVRETYLNKFGVPALVAVEQDYTGKAKDIALAYAKALGATRAGVLETTFSEETESDLLGEQAVLCGGVMSLIEKGYEVLREAGYQPELAYFEVCNELKLIVDLIYEKGLKGMLTSVSDTAKYGCLTKGYEIVDDHVKENMRKALEEIKSGEFAQKWTGNMPESIRQLAEMMAKMDEKEIEKVGRQIRKLAGIER